MGIKSDPLDVLLEVNNKLGLNVDEELISACYQLQKTHQYDKNRDTSKKMEVLIEEVIIKNEGDFLI